MSTCFSQDHLEIDDVNARHHSEDNKSSESESRCKNEPYVLGKRTLTIPEQFNLGDSDRMGSEGPSMLLTTSSLSTPTYDWKQGEKIGYTQKLEKKVKYLKTLLKLEPADEDVKQQYRAALIELIKVLS